MISDFAVIGLGAIGSSLMRALHARGVTVRGFDTDAATVALAQRDRFEAQLWTSLTRLDANVVIISVPVRATLEVMRALARRRDYELITDVGSTKRAVNQAAEANRIAHCFVGAHPLAGTERSGWNAGSADMFEGKTVYLCPTSQAQPEALAAARALWQMVGGCIRELSSDEHDERMAWLSHLPQLSATALALALRTGQVQRKELGRGGLDTTRLAASDPHIWLDILGTNADNIDEPLGCLIEALTDLRVGLRARNENRLVELLEAGHDWSAKS